MTPALFGIRHLSPGAAWHLVRLLEERQPDLVLVEGPSDLNGLMEPICRSGSVPPIAMMAYSQTAPIRTILYPFAEYSPEYQAILWAHRNQKACRFMDLPSSVFLAFEEKREKERQEPSPSDGKEESTGEPRISVYDRLAQLSGEPDEDSWWERRFEHTRSQDAYRQGAAEFGRQLRELSQDSPWSQAENQIREAYMKRMIVEAQKEIPAEKIVAVTGAYHVAGLEACAPMTDQELSELPQLPCLNTLMPYSYYRLSSLSGYGAGNKAPAYYEAVWEELQCGDPMRTAYFYLSGMAEEQRKRGNLASSAEVIEAVRLSGTLAKMRGSDIPTLQDLRDGAVTCMGHGNFSEISVSAAGLEIGTKIGRLPEGVSRTSVQEDFYRLLKDLKLDSYRTSVGKELELDLRENTRVKTEKAAFLDLERSFFLHRLAALGIHFAQKQAVRQDKGTWAERWVLQWTPEAEIEIVESALKGDTVELAAAFSFRERLEETPSISQAASVIADACLCGMAGTVGSATSVLQGLAVDSASLAEIAETAGSLSATVRYGSIRRLDPAPLVPVLQQLFLRACLILPTSCQCNHAASEAVLKAMGALNEIAVAHEEVSQEAWSQALSEVSNRDDLNTRASGYAAAILLERGQMDSALLSQEMNRRLSKGIPADLGAGWFEGLAKKNRYALIARLSLWEQLSTYIETLDDEEFKRALVFLRRAFSEFSAQERNEIAENLGEIWGCNAQQVSELLNGDLSQQEQEALSGLEDFDFDM